MRERQPCALSPCGCVMRSYEDPFPGGRRIQHGPNPEHSIVVTDKLYLESELCELGHIVEVEQWLARVVEREHGVGDA